MGNVIKTLPEDTETPQDIMRILFEAKVGVSTILKGIEKDAPDCLQVIMNNYYKPIRYYFDADRPTSFTDFSARNVYLRNSTSLLHETMHIDSNR